MSIDKYIDFSICIGKKNLLAFSAGIDSTALFYLLLSQKISFDIAMVNYNMRSLAASELSFAKNLAKKHNKKIFFLDTKIENSHFEQKARKIRFDFFKLIIKNEKYENLLTAHQLNDQLEWFLMQLSKGAGSLELLGMQKILKYDNYTLVKPLLEVSKKELQNYLNDKKLKYFIDESNINKHYKRNYFRHNFSNALIEEFQKGIARSFDYISSDNELLLKESKFICLKALTIIKAETLRSKLYLIDKDLKRKGYILSHAQRQDIEKASTIVISNAFAIEIEPSLVFIAPVVTVIMNKKFKEACRKAKIPCKIRPYLYKNGIELSLLQQKIKTL